MEAVKQLIRRMVRSDRAWRLIDWTVLRPARIAEEERRKIDFDRREAALLASMFPDLTVRHGPFTGICYPRGESVCSALLPKLLGSYERELHPTIELACRRAYPLVVDVGCAEGYYAVGLARCLPASQVLAYDTDLTARDLCRAMAAKNDVLDRVTVGERCGPDQLKEAVDGRPALVVCDCEGYEAELLVPGVIPALAAAFLFVEVHEFAVPGVTASLAERFAATHRVEAVASTDDAVKGRTYSYPELDALGQDDREFVVAERRPGGMEWLVLTPLGAG